MSDFLPFTLNNWRSVNLKLLKLIAGDGTEKALVDFYNALDISVKQDEAGQGLFSYAALKKAIQRDRKKLELAKDKAALQKLLDSQKSTKMQMRITPHQFLFQNALSVLGIKFESLFDPENLESPDVKISFFPETKPIISADITNEELFHLIESLGAKIDTYTTSTARSKRLKYTQKYLRVREYFDSMYTYFISFYDDPENNGFVKIAPNRTFAPLFSIRYYDGIEKAERFNSTTETVNRIYTYFRGYHEQNINATESFLYEYNFLLFFKPYISHKSETYKLLNIIESPEEDMGLNFLRIIGIMLILLCFTDLLLILIKSAKGKKKILFHKILKSKEKINLQANNINDFEMTNDLKELGEFENLYGNIRKKLIDLSNLLLSERSEIDLCDALCIEFESFFIRFYNIQHGLFAITLPVGVQMKIFLEKQSKPRTLVKAMNDLNPVAGDNFAFYYTKEQLDSLSELLPGLNKLQKKIKEYFIDNDIASSLNPVV